MAYDLSSGFELEFENSSARLRDTSGASIELVADEAWVLSLLSTSASAEDLATRAAASGFVMTPDRIREVVTRFLQDGVVVQRQAGGNTISAGPRAEVQAAAAPPSSQASPPAAMARPSTIALPPPLEASSIAPAVRHDLVVIRPPNAKGGIVEVEVPGSGRRYTIYDFELTLARLLNGKRRVSEILEAAGRLGIPADLKSLNQFIRQFARYGFLTAYADAQPAPPPFSEPTAQDERWTEGLQELLSSGTRLMRMGRPEEAKKYFQAILATEPDNRHALELLAVLESQLGASALTEEEDEPIAGGLELSEEEESSEAPAPLGLVDDEIDQHAMQRKRTVRRRALWVTVSVALVALLAYPFEHSITIECVVHPLERAAVRAPFDGLVAEILVKEGDAVNKDDVVAKLATGGLEKQLERREAEIAQAESDLRLLERGARPEELRSARSVVRVRTRALSIARRDEARVKKLHARRLASEEELVQAKQAVALQESSRLEARETLALLEAGARPEEIEKRKAEIRARMVDLDLVRSAIEGAVLKAPIGGIVTTPNLSEKENANVAVGTSILEIESLARVRVVGLAAEDHLRELRVGLRTEVKVYNAPGRVFTGEVSFVSPAIAVDPLAGRRTVRVETIVENRDRELAPNLSGFMKVDAGRRSILQLVSERFVRWVRVRFFL